MAARMAEHHQQQQQQQQQQDAVGQVQEEEGDLPTEGGESRPKLTGTGGSSSGNSPHSHGPSVSMVAKRAGNWLLSIVGLDLYTRGKAGQGLRKASQAGNPFDLGLRVNCGDFWTRGKELGVNYETLYDVPVQGFRSRHASLKRAGAGGGRVVRDTFQSLLGRDNDDDDEEEVVDEGESDRFLNSNEEDLERG